MSTLHRSLRHVVLSLALVVCLGTFVSTVRADEVPTFSAPEVNEFVAKFNKAADEVSAAMATADATKISAASEKLTTLMMTDGPAIDAKLTAEERPTFEKYIDARMKKATTPGT